MYKQSILALLLTSSASVAFAGGSDLVARASKKSGAEYLTLKAEVQADATARRRLETQVAAARFDRRSWKQDLEGLMLLSDRDEISRVEHLAGLDPQVYLRSRRPEPAVGTELRMMKLSPAALFVIYLKTFDVYPYAERSAYPVAVTDATFGALRIKERDALRQGLIVAIGASGHPAAPHLLADLMLDERVDETTRGLAAVHLGEAGGDVAEARLTEVLAGRGGELLKASALSGLGQVRTASSMALLAQTLEATKSLTLKKSAIAAIGNLGSAWALEADAHPEATTLRTRAATVLVGVLLSKDGAEVEPQTLEALTRTADAAALAQLRTALSGGLDAATAARAERAAARMNRALERL